MGLGVALRGEVLADKMADGAARPGHVEHAPGPEAVDSGVDEPPVPGLRRVVARVLPAGGGGGLEPEGCGGALPPHLRPPTVDADPRRPVAAVLGVALPGLTARGGGEVSGGAPRGRGRQARSSFPSTA